MTRKVTFVNPANKLYRRHVNNDLGKNKNGAWKNDCDTMIKVLFRQGHHFKHLSSLLRRSIHVAPKHLEKTTQIKPLDTVSKPVFKEKNDNEVVKEAEVWKEVKTHSLSERVALYAKLSKARLTGLVVLTAAAGYAIAPAPLLPLALATTVVGTTLCSAAANSFNQFLEVPYDCQMSRTRDRVLVKGEMRPEEAVMFGLGSSVLGVGLLSTVNPTTAILGLLNIVLYAGVYTPSKRYHVVNTWVGAVVGGIPPLMGYAACTGGLDLGSLTLAGILYSWQFPHFNALSWNYRPDYSRAGYKMMSVTDPALCRRVTLRHAVAQIPLSLAVVGLGVCHWSFIPMSLPANLYMTLLSWRFYRDSNSKTARTLFRFTLLHLPIVMLLLLICKKRTYKKNLIVESEASEEMMS